MYITKFEGSLPAIYHTSQIDLVPPKTQDTLFLKAGQLHVSASIFGHHQAELLAQIFSHRQAELLTKTCSRPHFGNRLLCLNLLYFSLYREHNEDESASDNPVPIIPNCFSDPHFNTLFCMAQQPPSG